MSAAAKVLWAATETSLSPKAELRRGDQPCHFVFLSLKLHLVQLSLWLSGMGKGFRLALPAHLCSIRKTTPEQRHIVTLTNHPGCWYWENIPMSRIGFCPRDIRVLKGHSYPSQCSAQQSSSPSWASALLASALPLGKPHTLPRQCTNTKLLPAALSILLFKGWRQWQPHRQCYLQFLAGSVGGGTRQIDRHRVQTGTTAPCLSPADQAR